MRFRKRHTLHDAQPDGKVSIVQPTNRLAYSKPTWVARVAIGAYVVASNVVDEIL